MFQFSDVLHLLFLFMWWMWKWNLCWAKCQFLFSFCIFAAAASAFKVQNWWCRSLWQFNSPSQQQKCPDRLWGFLLSHQYSAAATGTLRQGTQVCFQSGLHPVQISDIQSKCERKSSPPFSIKFLLNNTYPLFEDMFLQNILFLLYLCVISGLKRSELQGFWALLTDLCRNSHPRQHWFSLCSFNFSFLFP